MIQGIVFQDSSTSSRLGLKQRPPVLVRSSTDSAEQTELRGVTAIPRKIVDSSEMNDNYVRRVSNSVINTMRRSVGAAQEGPFPDPTRISCQTVAVDDSTSSIPEFSIRQTSTHIILVLTIPNTAYETATVVISPEGLVLLELQDRSGNPLLLLFPLASPLDLTQLNLVRTSATTENIVVSLPKKQRQIWEHIFDFSVITTS